MWTPTAPTAPREVEVDGNHYIEDAHLSKQAERLMPGASLETIDELDSFYERSKTHMRDAAHWGFFKKDGYNFAVCRPLSFILGHNTSSLNPSLHDTQLVYREDEDSGEASTNHSDITLMDSAEATMLDPARAMTLGERVLVPAITASYTNVDSVAGYSGYKTWVIAPEECDPESLFLIPEVTPHTVRASGQAENALAKEAPDLGPICSRQIGAVAARLTTVTNADRVKPPVFQY